MWYRGKKVPIRMTASSYSVQGKNSLCRKVKIAALYTSIHVPAYIISIKYPKLLWVLYDTVTYTDSSGRRRFPVWAV